MSSTLTSNKKEKNHCCSYNLIIHSVIRSKYIFVENDKIEILFCNYIFQLTFQCWIYNYNFLSFAYDRKKVNKMK